MNVRREDGDRATQQSRSLTSSGVCMLGDWYEGSPGRALRCPATMVVAARVGESLGISRSMGNGREQYGYGEADYCLDRPRAHDFEEQVSRAFSRPATL